MRTGAVAPAARDDAQGRFRRGDAVGFVEEEVLAWGEPRETLQAVLSELAQGADGERRARADQRARRRRTRRSGWASSTGMVNGGVELELRHGGQPAYWWLLAAE